jgi:hypothetical protein
MLKYLLAAVAAITVVASAHAAEDEVREAAPIGLVGEPWPPGSEQQGTVWMDPPPVGSPGGVYGGELPVLVTSGTWATASQLSGGVPSYMPAGYDVTTVAALWADGSVPLPTPNPLKANALQLPRRTARSPRRRRMHASAATSPVVRRVCKPPRKTKRLAENGGSWRRRSNPRLSKDNKRNDRAATCRPVVCGVGKRH